MMFPNKEMYKSDNIEPYLGDKQRVKYMDDLQKGKADLKDHERYMYGGTYNRKFYTDNEDRKIDSMREEQRLMERDAQRQIDRIMKQQKQEN